MQKNPDKSLDSLSTFISTLDSFEDTLDEVFSTPYSDYKKVGNSIQINYSSEFLSFVHSKKLAQIYRYFLR